MKQKKFGKKIINWRRPPGKDQFRRRYRRNRDSDQEYLDALKATGCVPKDRCWNLYDREYDRVIADMRDSCSCAAKWHGLWSADHFECRDMSSGEEARREFFLQQFFEGVSAPWPPQSAALDSLARLRKEEPSEVRVSARRHPAFSSIEKRLAIHMERIAHLSDLSVAAALRSERIPILSDSVTLADLFWNPDFLQHVESCLDQDEEGFVEVREVNGWEPHFDPADFANLLSLFSPFWIVRPQPNFEGGGRKLLEHLFVRYEAPRWLFNEWLRPLGEIRFKWICWFLIIAQGGSLRRAARYFGWRIPEGFQHHLLQAPAGATPVEACVYAEVRRLGGAEVDFRRILHNAAFVIDPTEPSSFESFEGFWTGTVSWLIRHSADITDEESDQILSWAMHWYTECERTGRTPFSMTGRGLRAVLEASRGYAEQNDEKWVSYQWNGSGLDWEPEELSAEGWRFVELTSGRELLREGEALHHCVASYAALCASGHSAIVSLSRNGIRRLTIELDPRTRQIVQVRGLQNRSASEKEGEVISRWLSAIQRGAEVPDRE